MNTSVKILATIGLAVAALLTLTASQIGFKYASGADGLKNTILWLVGAGVAGTVSMLLYTLLLKHIPLHVGYAILYGLGFVLIQVVAAKFILKEPVSLMQWIGGAVMVAGIAMVAFGGKTGLD